MRASYGLTIRMMMLTLAMAAILGCRDETAEPAAPATLPTLSIEEWKKLPVEEKYDGGTFERLRDADKSLRPDRAWQKFMKEVVIPERKIDIPGIPGQQQ